MHFTTSAWTFTRKPSLTALNGLMARLFARELLPANARRCGSASDIACRQYPFLSLPSETRNFTESQALRVFVRDGFIDRYSGNRLLFPPVLRVLSFVLPAEFPFHRNWKIRETHQSYWELFPTLDHIVPIARGGADKDENIVSTSMLRNSAKSNWTLEELDWSLHPPGDINQWDGMLGWFMEFINKNPQIAQEKYIARWQKAAQGFTTIEE